MIKLNSRLMAALLLGALLPSALAAPKTASVSRLGVVDSIVQDAISDGQIPGAVVLIGHDGQVIYRKAFGERALEPRREPNVRRYDFRCGFAHEGGRDFYRCDPTGAEGARFV